MNRIEIIGLFTAIDMLLEEEKYDKVRILVQKVLNEAESKPSRDKKKEKNIN